MNLIKSSILIAVASCGCVTDSVLIKANEGPVNYTPGDSRTVCWGCNKADLLKYLNISYDDYARTGTPLSSANCD